MTSRDRVINAMHYRLVDKVPVQFYYTPVGYYEHGEKLNGLFETLPGDFEPFRSMQPPVIEPSEFDAYGKYHSFQRDKWGTLWEFRIFGIAGLPVEYPLADISELGRYVFPSPPPLSGPKYEEYRKKVAAHKQQYYFLQHTGSLFERLIALRPEEDVLCDIALNEPLINLLADRIVEYNTAYVARAVSSKADGISFGDDYGTQRGMIMSPETWRAFFKPRLKKLFMPAVKSGLDIHFHSCGQISEILEDLREIGVTSIWPQLPAYDMGALADRCRELDLAVAVHTDRAGAMTLGTPMTVRDLVMQEYEVFRMRDGGSWFYIEADNGFPFENLEALVNTIKALRR